MYVDRVKVPRVTVPYNVKGTPKLMKLIHPRAILEDQAPSN